MTSELIMTFNKIYIWIYLNNEIPTLVGRLSVANHSGIFQYAHSYLNHENAVSIDPIQLPLNDKPIAIRTLKGIPSCLLDVCPDQWGRHLLDKIYGVQSYPIGYLLKNDSARLGNLAFSISPNIAPDNAVNENHFSLKQLLSISLSVDNNEIIPASLLSALNPSLGGARPKCTIELEQIFWLAKFSSNNDPKNFSIPKLENATMKLAKNCGINVAETKLIEIDGNNICLVRRFDRDIINKNIIRHAAISARTVFYSDAGFEQLKTGSYARFARAMTKFGASNEDKIELFKRMAFNCLVKNTDDHELNHLLIRKYQAKKFSLSPAFDIVPQLAAHKIHHHALIIGHEGSAGTIENILSSCESFGLTKDEAARIFNKMSSDIQNYWQDVFYEASFDDRELRYIEHCFKPLPYDKHDVENEVNHPKNK